MVNEEARDTHPPIRASILRVLRETSGTVSGEDLSRLLDVSRVAVWKQIQCLKDAGYSISSGSRGYQLDDSPDVLSALEFPETGKILVYPSLPSTMEEASRLRTREDGTVVLAQVQTAGRGRLDRVWSSEAGGLYLTLILHPDFPLSLAWRYTFAAATALRAALLSLYGIDTQVKWPNDLLWEGKKCAGILTEVQGNAGAVSDILIGIGLNVRNALSLPGTAVLERDTGKAVSRKDIILRFLQEFRKREADLLSEEVIREWKAVSSVMNRRIQVLSSGSVLEGTAVDIDVSGALIIRTSGGVLRRAYYGDVLQM